MSSCHTLSFSFGLSRLQVSWDIPPQCGVNECSATAQGNAALKSFNKFREFSHVYPSKCNTNKQSPLRVGVALNVLCSL